MINDGPLNPFIEESWQANIYNTIIHLSVYKMDIDDAIYMIVLISQLIST